MQLNIKTILGVAVVALSFGAVGKLQPSSTELDLSGTWHLVKADDAKVSCPIAVPGGVHSALLKAKLIEDSFWGRNETNNLWVGKSSWVVSRTFEVNGDFLAKKEIVLRLEDCDTFAEVSVNGTVVGSTTDRFQRYTFDVKPCLKAGENEISVRFSSPEAVADARHERVKKPFPISNVVWAKNQALIRKPACHAGWDWGPSVQVIGLCGTVKLLASDKPRIDYIYTTQTFSDDLSHCTLDVFADLSDGTTVTNRIEIDDPPLWWPNGAGEQKFYTYTVDVNGEKVTRRIGLRKLEVLNERTVSPDGKDELSLVFRVNNRRLFMKGANWIPCSAYENEQTPARYAQILGSAKRANMNMIRVWGGGQFEKDVFYDLCDELGILIWHDMMFSCAVYPAADWFLDEIRDELAHQLRRLRDHASIAMWCGDNECLGAINWFDETRDDKDFYRGEWMARSKMQGEMVAKYDPTRTYWPSSPCCGPGDFGNAWKDDSKGDMHNWDVWHENAPFSKYEEYHPRFCSEFGFQSFPSMEVAEMFASKEQILARGPDFEWHQKGNGGNERIRKTLERYFPKPKEQILARGPDFEWHQKGNGGNERIRKTLDRYFPKPKDVPSELLLSQFQQAMAIQTAVDAWRSEQPRCMGTLFWQLNDNWPVASWSAIEYGGKWKPLQYLARRFFEPIHVTLAPDGMVKVVNNTEMHVCACCIVVFHGFDGKEEQFELAHVEIDANSVIAVKKITPRDDAVLELRFADSVNFPVRADYKGNLPKAKVNAEIDGFKVTLTADKPAFWTWMDVRGIRGEFDDNAVTLVPGIPRTFVFTPYDKTTSPQAFKSAFSVTHLADLCK